MFLPCYYLTLSEFSFLTIFHFLFSTSAADEGPAAMLRLQPVVRPQDFAPFYFFSDYTIKYK